MIPYITLATSAIAAYTTYKKAYTTYNKYFRSELQIKTLHFNMGQAIVRHGLDTVEKAITYYRATEHPELVKMVYNSILVLDDLPAAFNAAFKIEDQKITFNKWNWLYLSIAGVADYGISKSLDNLMFSYPEYTKLFLILGADVNAQDKDGQTPLIWAFRNNNIDLVKTLIAAGADVNAQDKDGQTPLIWASLNRDNNLAKTLVEAGADVNAANKNGKTPLSLVIRMEEKNQIDAMQKLLNLCANPNDADELNQSLLHLAAARTNIEAIDLLFKYGANPHALDHARNKPIKYAANKEVANFIAQKTIEYDSGCLVKITCGED